MAKIIAIAGDMNSGKSSGRDTMRRPDQQFILSNTLKDLHLHADDPAYAPYATPRQLAVGIKGKTKADNLATNKKFRDSNLYSSFLIKVMDQVPSENVISGGNHDFCQINEIGTYMRFVSEFMPQVKELHIEDLTHFITARITSPEFLARKKGDEAFARYVDLAADFMNNTLHVTKSLREDLIVCFYYHTLWSEDEMKYNIRVPGGKLLEEKFFPGSYFDHMLMSRVIRQEHVPELDYEDRFRYIIRPGDRYSGRTDRFAFKGIQDLPNDLQYFVDRIRISGGIPLDHTPKSIQDLPEIKTNITIGIPEL